MLFFIKFVNLSLYLIIDIADNATKIAIVPWYENKAKNINKIVNTKFFFSFFSRNVSKCLNANTHESIDSSIIAISVKSHNSIEKGLITITVEIKADKNLFLIYLFKVVFKKYIANVVKITANKNNIVWIV